jgi:uncharacterized membrane protein YidH (DUF202 family)
MAWLFCITGTVFCLTGVYQFKKNVFEEERRISLAVFLMIAGVILIAVGTARYFKLIG